MARGLCVELCSRHLRPDRDPQNLVASALFSDGAAGAVLIADERSGTDAVGRLTQGHSRLITRGRNWMSWRITDTGFAMTLDRRVPSALRDEVATIVDQESHDGPAPGCFVVHPGGPGILEAVDRGLSLGGGRGLEVARDVLRRFGNMSSATLLLVLAESLRAGYHPPALLMAFGPGLAVETMTLRAR